jgi:phage tail protein X
MADFTTYETTGGENWGLIAYKAYGDAALIKPITDANPTVKIDTVLPSGLVLSIPIITENENSISPDLLPPWKR